MECEKDCKCLYEINFCIILFIENGRCILWNFKKKLFYVGVGNVFWVNGRIVI